MPSLFQERFRPARLRVLTSACSRGELAGLHDVLNSFHGAHVLGAFESGRIGASHLAHAALHLLDGFIFVRFHPLANALLD